MTNVLCPRLSGLDYLGILLTYLVINYVEQNKEEKNNNG